MGGQCIPPVDSAVQPSTSFPLEQFPLSLSHPLPTNITTPSTMCSSLSLIINESSHKLQFESRRISQFTGNPIPVELLAALSMTDFRSRVDVEPVGDEMHAWSVIVGGCDASWTDCVSFSRFSSFFARRDVFVNKCTFRVRFDVLQTRPCIFILFLSITSRFLQ